MIEVNMLKDCVRDAKLPPMPKELNDLWLYLWAAVAGNLAGFVLMYLLLRRK